MLAEMGTPSWCRAFLFFLCGLVLCPPTWTQTVEIVELGLQGYVDATPFRVLVEVKNPQAKPVAAELRFHIGPNPPRGEAGDHWTLPVSLNLSETKRVEVPLALLDHRYTRLAVEVHPGDGGTAGHAVRVFERTSADYLLAMLCSVETTCQEIQKQITFSGTMEEQVEKGKDYRYAPLRTFPQHGWGYVAADVIVVAAPLGNLTAEQKAALEEALRGTKPVILVEDEVSDPSFLAAYRQGPAGGEPQAVGGGTLYRIPSLRGGMLGSLYPTRQGIRRWTGELRTSYMELGLGRLARHFEFPSLGWLLGWLFAYVLVVGAVNYTVLSRMGRREWGWLTVPAIAMAFAAGLYASSAAKRPPNFGVDEVALYRMDDRSRLASGEIGVRISSPQRSRPEMVLPGEIAVQDWPRMREISISRELLDSNDVAEEPREFRLGPPLRFNLPMLQWSYDNLQVTSKRTRSGTVRRLADGRLRNEMGLHFRQAIYVDSQNVYLLGEVAAGAEVDLSHAKKEFLSRYTNRHWIGNRWVAETSLQPQGPQPPPEKDVHAFELTDLLSVWPEKTDFLFEARSGFFFGLADEDVLGLELAGQQAARKSYSITVVSLGREP